MEFAFFPGCAGHGTARDQDLSTRAVLAALGVTVRDLSDWNCCGATPGHTVGGELATQLSLRNLRIASDTGLDLVVPCASCYGNLKRASVTARTGGDSDAARAEVLSIVTLLSGPALLERIQAMRRVDLSAARMVTYYGCLLVRPHATLNTTDPENPQGMEAVALACGVDPIDWPHKTDCCGGPNTVSHPEMVGRLSDRLIDRARRFGAEAVVTACPMCHSSLETAQWPARRRFVGAAPIPVLYLSELVAAALGLNQQRQWLKRHLIDPRPVLERWGGR